ncbi:MAG: M48 family metallopeptidase [Planctomycetes bacterium]|nr:M48 family metallopeptidase [Planctomycetota bacterium]
MSGMDFFGHQERARASSRRLVLLFVAAVAAIVACIYAVAAALFAAAEDEGLWQPQILLAVTAGTLLVVGLASAFKTMQLRSGGRKVAELLGGEAVDPGTSDPRERMLRNVVEEMAIASGVPVPDVYVLDGEPGINAFAAGWSPADAAVAVTRGALENLDRDELQGVIAHEFSHVFHGDMRLNIRLMGVLFGIVCIATIGRIVVRAVGRGGGGSGRGKGGAAAVLLFGLALVLIGWLGVLFARLIQAAVSRQREFLADASAVQYTRNPRGIGLALAKIGGIGGTLQSAHTEEASHLLFADGLRRAFGGGFATHPPLEARVERILPGFRRQLASSGSMVAAVQATPLPPGLYGLAAAGPAPARTVAAAELVRTVGAPEPRHVVAARDLLRDLPLDLAAAARAPGRAHPLVLALLLDRQPARRQEQLASIAARDPALAHEATVLFQARTLASPRALLPLLGLALPALRALPPAGRAQVRGDARALALFDGALSPFEFALLKGLERHLRAPGDAPPRPPGRPTALLEHPREAAIVLSVLARAGARGEEVAANRAFAQGLLALGTPGQAALLPAEACPITALEAAVDALAAVSPLGKRNLLEACAAAAGADGQLADDEADLLRALAELWDCPVPLVTTPEGAPVAAPVTG